MVLLADPAKDEPAHEGLASSGRVLDFLATSMRCLCCRENFVADRRNQHHQKFCSKPACRQASKRSSQRAWLTQPQNQDYFRGPAHSERVRAWRQNHPRYWQKRRKKPVGALQDVCPAQVAEPQPLEQADSQDLFRRTLQDVCRVQTPLLVGLISQMIDSPLQEDIVGFVRRVVAKGQDQLIAEHPRNYDRRQDVVKAEHEEELLAQRRAGRREQLLMKFMALSPQAQAYHQHLSDKRANPQHHVQKIMALAEQYGSDKVARALEDALTCHAYSAEYIANILAQREKPRVEPGALHLTRQSDLLDLDLPAPDLSLYDPQGGAA